MCTVYVPGASVLKFSCLFCTAPFIVWVAATLPVISTNVMVAFVTDTGNARVNTPVDGLG